MVQPLVSGLTVVFLFMIEANPIKIRAYFSHALIDWLMERFSSGSFPSKPRLGVLYDIGCNIEKGLIRVSKSLFIDLKLCYSSIL